MRNIILIALSFCFVTVFGQDDMFSEKRERHKVWKNWNRKRDAYNPYLDRKRKDKPSVKMARDNKKEVKRQQRRAKKVMRQNKRSIHKANRRRMKGG